MGNYENRLTILFEINMRILVIDDEPELLEQIGRALIEQQYTVDLVTDGEKAMERLYCDPYDLILLDIMLPVMDGFDVLREMRAENINTPVLMLTAKGDIEDRVKGLDLGADDYLPKPFSIAELMARVRALLRRNSRNGSSLLQVKNIKLNTSSRELTVDNKPVKLTPKEFLILEFLLYNKNRAVSRFNIAEHVWGDEFDPFTMSNNIDVHVKNLRRKTNDIEGKLVTTVRGVGYMVIDES